MHTKSGLNELSYNMINNWGNTTKILDSWWWLGKLLFHTLWLYNQQIQIFQNIVSSIIIFAREFTSNNVWSYTQSVKEIEAETICTMHMTSIEIIDKLELEAKSVVRWIVLAIGAGRSQESYKNANPQNVRFYCKMRAGAWPTNNHSHNRVMLLDCRCRRIETVSSSFSVAHSPHMSLFLSSSPISVLAPCSIFWAPSGKHLNSEAF